MADTRTFSHASTSENVHSIVMYTCTNFGAFITKWTISLVCCCTTSRLTRLRQVRCKECKEPTATMTKLEVEEQHLGGCVVMPANLDWSFKSWWRSIEPTDEVEVRTPHGRHGNAGKVSHSAKVTTHENFIEFVDVNSQPNGRSADSSGPTFYFRPKYLTIQMPKKGTSHYQEQVKRS